MRMIFGDVHQSLLRSVRNAIAADSWLGKWSVAGSSEPALVIEDFNSTPWASLTFTGRRHSIALRLTGPTMEVEAAYDRLVALLTEPAFELKGHFRAEIDVVDVDASIDLDGGMRMAVTVEALTIAE
ncbi:MAG: hypothetical protein ACK4MX_00240 [Thermaurantiacus sp.]